MTDTAVCIRAGELTKAVPMVQVAVGESRILNEHWTKIAVVAKGEASLLVALQVQDKRTVAKP